jgi:V/A-type H+/Na+-transporting ATPase subunit K
MKESCRYQNGEEMIMEKVLLGFAAALAIGLSAIATGWAQSKIGAAGAGAIAEKPELTGTMLIMLAIPETMVILGFVVATMILYL